MRRHRVRNTVNAALGGALSAALALAAGGCGSPSAQRVSDARIPFTFTVPAHLSVEHVAYTQTDPPILVEAATGLGDDYDHVDVRRAKAAAVSEAAMVAGLDRFGSAGPTISVLEPPRTETHSGLRTATGAFRLIDGSQAVHIVIYTFATAGSTWEMECEATQPRRSTVDNACNQAINSIQANRSK
ncbi:MAG: hypothetical protein M3Y91_14225 [Actinomycetota bacterium]|nr:hypothetical protein [Actinomycetota bacterium]